MSRCVTAYMDSSSSVQQTLSNDDVVTNYYICCPDLPSATMSNDGPALSNDGLALSNDRLALSNDRVAHYEYNPYGVIINATGTLKNEMKFRFSSKYWDDETGLGYWGYRFYSPELGRWFSRDPISEDGGLLLYGFCGNEPVGKWDWLGMVKKDYIGSLLHPSEDIDKYLESINALGETTHELALEGECICDKSGKRYKAEFTIYAWLDVKLMSQNALNKACEQSLQTWMKLAKELEGADNDWLSERVDFSKYIQFNVYNHEISHVKAYLYFADNFAERIESLNMESKLRTLDECNNTIKQAIKTWNNELSILSEEQSDLRHQYEGRTGWDRYEPRSPESLEILHKLYQEYLEL